jgi:hypothetical protein
LLPSPSTKSWAFLPTEQDLLFVENLAASRAARLRTDEPWRVPKIHALYATYFAGLRKAGMPEE